MQHLRADPTDKKGWWIGSWNSDLAIALGYAHQGIDDPHAHRTVTEIYLVAQGSSTMRIERETVELRGGDVIVVSPGKAHTFIGSSGDYLHFVIHSPSLSSDAVRADRVTVER